MARRNLAAHAPPRSADRRADPASERFVPGDGPDVLEGGQLDAARQSRASHSPISPSERSCWRARRERRRRACRRPPRTLRSRRRRRRPPRRSLGRRATPSSPIPVSTTPTARRPATASHAAQQCDRRSGRSGRASGQARASSAWQPRFGPTIELHALTARAHERRARPRRMSPFLRPRSCDSGPRRSRRSANVRVNLSGM